MKRIPGEAGLWAFILGDLTIFGLFFGVVLYYRADQPELFAASQAQLSQGLGLANTIVLLSSSLLVVLGVAAARERRAVRAQRLLGGALLCGLAFAAIKAYEYADKLDADLTARTNDFYLCFYAFTGVHLLHVLIGTAVLGALCLRVRRTAVSDPVVEGGACYWHMVDLLWLVLFPLLYLAN